MGAALVFKLKVNPQLLPLAILRQATQRLQSIPSLSPCIEITKSLFILTPSLVEGFDCIFDIPLYPNMYALYVCMHVLMDT